MGIDLYEHLYDRVLTRIPPERAHHLAVASLRAMTADARVRNTLRRLTFPTGDVLSVEALGLRIPSPLGVAAGLDKDASWFQAAGAIGFGFVEVGTVTPRPQPGNPQPRIARITADHALVNRMGFPSGGASLVATRLAVARGEVVVGANIGKNRDTPIEDAAIDYRELARRLAPHADYVVLNVSSPNTPGLRALESVAALEPLIAAVRPVLAEMTPPAPLLVKISPDLADEDVDAVAELALSAGLAGVIATNTTVDRAVLSPAGAEEIRSFEGGGISGPPLAARSQQVVARLYAKLRGTGVVIISVGGVSTAEDVWQRILAGATLVQAYTGFIYGGPGWPATVNKQLARRVRAAGATNIAELIGSGGSAG